MMSPLGQIAVNILLRKNYVFQNINSVYDVATLKPLERLVAGAVMKRGNAELHEQNYSENLKCKKDKCF